MGGVAAVLVVKAPRRTPPVRRFVVRRLEGFRVTRATAGYRLPGLTVWVADEWVNGREVAVFRSEDFGGTREDRYWRAETQARALADRLNAEHKAEMKEAVA